MMMNMKLFQKKIKKNKKNLRNENFHKNNIFILVGDLIL